MYGFSSWLNTFGMSENTTRGSWLGAPSLSASYLFRLKLRQLYLVGRWNKLHACSTTIVLQNNTFQNM